jgi:N-formylglutamate amidohydrolase
MHDRQVIIGTRHGRTSHAMLAAYVEAIFTAHAFEVHHNISGYSGGNVVRTYGRPETHQVHAIQIEINAALLMTTPRQEFSAQVSRGETPAKHESNIERLRVCMQELIETLPAVLTTLHRCKESP